MNLYDKESDDFLFVNFNQNCTTLAVVTKKSFKLYNIKQIDNLEVIHESFAQDMFIVERLFSSHLIAIVMRSAPRKLKVCNFKKEKELCNYSYSNAILSVKLNRLRLVVCLEESLYIHDIKDMKILHIIRDTPPNPSGLCALSINDRNSFLAYPGSSSIGEVQIFDALNLQAKSIIPAHDNPLAAMTFDPTGTMLATASKKGTIIRVFNVLDGTELYKFRRGLSRSASIYSLSFSDNSMLLCASSNTETVHLFKLEEIKDNKAADESESWMSYVGKAFVRSATYFPAQVVDVFSPGRSFAAVHLPFFGLKNMCSLVTIQNTPRIVIVASNGNVYFYDFDPVDGGDCTLIQTHKIIDCDDDIEDNTDNVKVSSAAVMPETNNNKYSNQTGGASYAAVVRGNEKNSPQVNCSKTKTTNSCNLPSKSLAKSELKIYDKSEFPPMDPSL